MSTPLVQLQRQFSDFLFASQKRESYTTAASLIAIDTRLQFFRRPYTYTRSQRTRMKTPILSPSSMNGSSIQAILIFAGDVSGTDLGKTILRQPLFMFAFMSSFYGETLISQWSVENSDLPSNPGAARATSRISHSDAHGAYIPLHYARWTPSPSHQKR